MLKDLLVVVSAAEDEPASLAQAIALSAGYNIAPVYVAVVPGPPPLANILGADIVDSLVHEAKMRAAKGAEQLRNRISAAVLERRKDVNIVKESRSLAEAVANIENLARSRDLTILERPQSFASESSAIFEAVLFSSGRPVLLAVPGRASARFERAVFAWDGSIHATRALATMISLFPDLKEVLILTVLHEKNLDDSASGAEIAAHIRRHGIQATVNCIDLDQFAENAGLTIASFAKARNVDLIVMGGYGHSRLREFLLGGVTEYLSRHSEVPLLLMH